MTYAPANSESSVSSAKPGQFSCLPSHAMPARPSHRPASTVLVVAARRGHADAVHALLDAGERSCRDDPRLTCLLRDRLSFVEPHAELQPQRLQLYVRAAPAPLKRVHSGLGFSLRAARGLGSHLYRLCLLSRPARLSLRPGLAKASSRPAPVASAQGRFVLSPTSSGPPLSQLTTGKKNVSLS